MIKPPIPNSIPETMTEVVGLNVREPFATLIAIGKKTIETRRYKPPRDILGKRIAIVATGIGRSQIIGSMIVDSFFQYQNLNHFDGDVYRHYVTMTDPNFRYRPDKTFFGWNIRGAVWYCLHHDAPSTTGRVMRNSCLIYSDDLKEN